MKSFQNFSWRSCCFLKITGNLEQFEEVVLEVVLIPTILMIFVDIFNALILMVIFKKYRIYTLRHLLLVLPFFFNGVYAHIFQEVTFASSVYKYSVNSIIFLAWPRIESPWPKDCYFFFLLYFHSLKHNNSILVMNSVCKTFDLLIKASVI